MELKKKWSQYLIKKDEAKTIIGGENPPDNPWDLFDWLDDKLIEWQEHDGIIDFGDDWPYLDPWEADPLDLLPEEDDGIFVWPSDEPKPTDGTGNPYYI